MTALKRSLVTLLKFSISIGILAYLFVQASRQDQFALLTEGPKRWGWLAAALAAGLAATLISFYRWWALVRALGIPFSLFEAIRLGFVSQIFNFLSVGVLGGDTVRAVAAARQAPQRMPEAVAAVVIDRAIGLWSMLLFAGAAYGLSDVEAIQARHPETLRAVNVVCGFSTAVAVAGLVAAIAVFLIPEARWAPIDRGLQRRGTLGALASRLLNVVLIYRRNKPQLVAATLNSLTINALFAASIYCIAHGLSDAHPTLGQHLVIAPIVMVANAAPLPGGLGGMEFALDQLYKAYSQASLPTEHGFVVALGYRIVWLIVTAIGLVFYWTSPRAETALDAAARDARTAS